MFYNKLGLITRTRKRTLTILSARLELGSFEPQRDPSYGNRALEP